MTGNQAGRSAQEQARLRREKIQRLERSAAAWEAGATGEQATGQVLSRLDPALWTIWHDVRWPGRQRANIDHVVVGPPGVFVIDSKNWSGTVAITDGVLRQNGRSREKEVIGAADAGIAVLEIVPDVPVYPVLCLVREESFTGWVRDVMLCSTGNLDVMVQTRPHALSSEQARATAARLGAGLSRGGRAQPPPRRAPSTGSRVSSRGRSMVKPLVGLLLMLFLLVGLQTGLYSGAGAWIGEKYVGLFVDDSAEPKEKGGKRERERRGDQ